MHDNAVLWWIKKDFRLADNPALTAALATGRQVIPVFIFEPGVLAAAETSAFHVSAWCEALLDLRRRLQAAGGQVLILRGEAVDCFAQLREQVTFDRLFSHEEIGSNLTYRRDRLVAEWCKQAGVAWAELPQTGVFRGKLDRDKRAKRWKAFMDPAQIQPTPERSGWARLGRPDGEAGLPDAALTPAHFGHPLTTDQQQHRQAVSETAADETLQSFLYERGQCYSGGISSPNSAFVCGSRLSVHLAWGTITGRRVYAATQARKAELAGDTSAEAKQWRRSLTSFLSRLHWRDHFVQRLETETDMEYEPLNAAYAELPTPGDPYLEDWLGGRTGWPLVDACMRCAAATGFLNFRMRAFITSVAVHSLRIDWRKIIHPTARLWADYEPGIHISQTQMQAGVVGINQLRVYSPDKQLADHDPNAEFVRRWVPELTDVPAVAVLHHHEEPIAGYPAPLVDWRENSQAMKAAYYAIKRLPATKELAEKVYAKHGSRKGPRGRRSTTKSSKTPS